MEAEVFMIVTGVNGPLIKWPGEVRGRFSSLWSGRTAKLIVRLNLPECLRSYTDSRPSLKRLNHTNVLAWLKAWSPKASFSIRRVSTAVFFSFKQNLMQILCSLTSAISIIADTWKQWKRNSQNSENMCTYKDASWLTNGWKIQPEAPSGASS